MGHLSNPIGFRLSCQKNWIDNWFVKNLYYPEYINGMLNIRDYLYYYLTRKKSLKCGICLSHFNILKIKKKYIIKIFIYHIDLEKLSYAFINKCYYIYYQMLANMTWRSKKKDKKKIAIIRELQNSDLFIFFFTFLNYYNVKLQNNCNLKKNRFIKNFKNKFLIKTNIRFFNDIFLKSFKNNIKKRSKKNKNRYVYINGKRYSKNYIKKIKSDEYKRIISRLSEIKSIKELNKNDVKILNYFFQIIEDKKDKIRLFYSFLSSLKIQSNQFRYIYFNKKMKLKRLHSDRLLKHKYSNFSFLFFFIYIMKKLGFKKYKNSFSLHLKWYRVGIYYKLFKYFKFKGKPILKKFLFFLSIYIKAGKNALKKKFRFNLRNFTYIIIYNLIGKIIYLIF